MSNMLMRRRVAKIEELDPIVKAIITMFPELNPSTVKGYVDTYSELSNFGNSYIQGDGKNLFYTPHRCSNKTRVICLASPVSGTNIWLFGTGTAWYDKGYGIRMGTNYRSTWYGNNILNNKFSYISGKHLYDFYRGSLNIDNIRIYTEERSFTFTTDNALPLFGNVLGKSVDTKNRSKIYVFGIYEDNSLLGVYVPINTGFLDLCNGTVYAYNGYGVDNI